jgi:hypothetical protein
MSETPSLPINPEVSAEARQRFIDFAKSRTKEVESRIPGKKQFSGTDSITASGQLVPVNHAIYEVFEDPASGASDASISLGVTEMGHDGQKYVTDVYGIALDQGTGSAYSALGANDTGAEIESDTPIVSMVSQLEDLAAAGNLAPAVS